MGVETPYELHFYQMFELDIPLMYRSALGDDLPSNDNQADHKKLKVPLLETQLQFGIAHSYICGSDGIYESLGNAPRRRGGGGYQTISQVQLPDDAYFGVQAKQQ